MSRYSESESNSLQFDPIDNFYESNQQKFDEPQERSKLYDRIKNNLSLQVFYFIFVFFN